jgi:hypothetical protein
MQNTYIFKILPLLFIGLTLLAGCRKEKEKELVLAQVGTTTLTLAELRESFPIEFEHVIRRQQYLDFITRWIDDEVVYQHAQKVGFAKDSVVARKLAKLSRKLLIEEFLTRENGADVFEPDEMTMSQYYEMHKEDFRRNTTEFKIVHLRVQTSKQAADLRAKIIRGDFLEIAISNSLDPAPESYASIGFKKLDGFPTCLAQAISNTAVNGITAPIECPDGVYLVKLLDRQEAGTFIPLTDTKEEIRNLLVMGRKDKITEARITKLKDGLNIGYNLDQIPGQIEAPKTHVAAKEVLKDTTPAEMRPESGDAPAAPKSVVKIPKPTVTKLVKAKRVKPKVSSDIADSTLSNQSGNETRPSNESPPANVSESHLPIPAGAKSEAEENIHDK